MPRTLAYSAVILRSRPSGESNREVWLLTAEAGLIHATLFGGPKSKLRSHAAPFHSGKAWIYHDPVKDFYKLNDFDVQSWKPGLREMYERTMAADAVAQTVLASHGGGGDWKSATGIVEETFCALEAANEEYCRRIQLHFFWQWINFLGLRPQFEYCASCERAVAQSEPVWYAVKEDGAVCADCASHERENAGNILQISPGCRRWLAAVEALSPLRLCSYTMDNKSLNETKALTSAILAQTLGRRLNSWDW
jgi:DNA repair protein RecO (recombination protein O)